MKLYKETLLILILGAAFVSCTGAPQEGHSMPYVQVLKEPAVCAAGPLAVGDSAVHQPWTANAGRACFMDPNMLYEEVRHMVSFGPRHTGSEAHNRYLDYLIAWMEGIGLVEIEKIPVSITGKNLMTRGPITNKTSDHLYGLLPGSTNQRVILGVHSDGQNAIQENGVPVLMAITQYLSRIPQAQRRYTYVVAFPTGHMAAVQGGIDAISLAQHKPDIFNNVIAAIAPEHMGVIQPGGGPVGYSVKASRGYLQDIAQQLQGKMKIPSFSVRTLGIGSGLAWQWAALKRLNFLPMVSGISTPTYLFDAQKGMEVIDKQRLWDTAYFYLQVVLSIEARNAKGQIDPLVPEQPGVNPPDDADAQGAAPGNPPPPTEPDPSQPTKPGVAQPVTPEPGASLSDSCLSTASGNFADKGPYTFSKQNSDGYTFYLPKTGDASCKHPVIAFAMGTSAPSLLYTHYYEHFASYGFAVVVDPNMSALTGRSLREGIDKMYAKHGSLLSEVVGTMGHSQGGAGALNASSHPRVKAVVGLQPGQFSTSGNMNVAYLGLAGSLDMFSIFTDPQLRDYQRIKGPKFYGKQEGASHIIGTTNTTAGKNFAAIAAAWFHCYLVNNAYACSLFVDKSCTKFSGKWSNCTGENLR